MKRHIACLMLGLSALAALPDVADAQGYGRAPGIRVMGAGQAVPAPAPVPEAPARWYFRADFGLGVPNEPSARERGLVLGLAPPAGSGTFGTNSRWFQSDDDLYLSYGFGVGYVFSRFLRGDLTIDSRTEREFKANAAAYSYTTPGPTTITGAYTDVVRHRPTTTLFNLYFDLDRFGSLTPYVGAGVGFAVNSLSRSASAVESAGGTTFSGREKVHDVSLAAMATAGLTYHIDQSIALDFNYRLLYVEGSDVTMPLNGNTSRFSIGDQFDHQLRAGIRLNVY